MGNLFSFIDAFQKSIDTNSYVIAHSRSLRKWATRVNSFSVFALGADADPIHFGFIGGKLDVTLGLYEQVTLLVLVLFLI